MSFLFFFYVKNFVCPPVFLQSAMSRLNHKSLRFRGIRNDFIYFISWRWNLRIHFFALTLFGSHFKIFKKNFIFCFWKFSFFSRVDFFCFPFSPLSVFREYLSNISSTTISEHFQAWTFWPITIWENDICIYQVQRQHIVTL